jgi:hypothetical protein
VLPLLEHDGWQVETMPADLHTGLPERIEIRHDGNVLATVATAAERDMVLAAHHLTVTDFAETDTIRDGCE